MPKGKRKGKSDRYVGSSTSDDESINDNMSVISVSSEVKSADGEEETDEISQQELFEDKILEAMDGLTQKSAQGRTTCFESINKAFIKKYIVDFVYERKLTLCDCVEKGLKRGRGAEQAAAAQLASLLCVQLGDGNATEEVCRALKPLLLVSANDNSVASTTRAKCCTALGLITFLAGGEMGEVLELMQNLESIFSGSYLKGDGSVPNITSEMGILHAAALSSWALLFTLMSPGDVYSRFSNQNSFSPSIKHLTNLLQSPHLEVRLASGEALALIFELGREHHDDFGDDDTDTLIADLRQLATDSHKYRAKKDRKTQRASFRDIVNYIENDQLTDVRIKFGDEILILDSWMRRKQYDSLCTMLGSGFNNHLSENQLIREIFELGDRVVIFGAKVIPSKLERHLEKAAAFKARTISRNKNRDKRSDF